nr:immunoglobulin light chain junction region [Macaca mulatta]MOW39364.1 immunoglobulin light chain junction region [Macaca mulatta]MOW39381.1 immunoglobulin light chain junction region [Macaca mulatta]MOW39707.1 immunoglobulin light chain junction region [Macaca mulatta]MOW39783.1 immunoglobulin light chain junction region [Macaca mulatta]
CQHHNSYPPTF